MAQYRRHDEGIHRHSRYSNPSALSWSRACVSFSVLCHRRSWSARSPALNGASSSLLLGSILRQA